MVDKVAIRKHVGQLMADSNERRNDWNKDDYTNAIKTHAIKSLVEVCILMGEVKEKFYDDESNKTYEEWKSYCKNYLGISHTHVSKYITIYNTLLPLMDPEKMEALGVRKLHMIASIGDEKKIKEIIEKVDDSMTVRDVKNVIDSSYQQDLPADSTPGKPSPKKIKKMMTKVDFALAEWMPSINVPNGNDEFKDFSINVANEAWDLYNRLREVIEASELFVLN